MFKLDRHSFSKGKSVEAKNEMAFWLSKSSLYRLSTAWYLICAAYDLDVNNVPRLDKNSFSCGKQ